MKYAIVYSTRTGNTKMLADAVLEALEGKDVIYAGVPDDRAYEADVIFLGFWTDKGKPNEESAEVLRTMKNKKVFLFGSAGFGGEESYYQKIIERAENMITRDNTILGYFMCQGKMPMSVKERYEKMKSGIIHIPHMERMIENFDKALTHPDKDDQEALKNKVRKTIENL